MNATDRYKILQNIIAQKGIDSDLFSELAKVEATINAIDQGKMMPPPVPPEITQPTTQPNEPIPQTTEPTMGKYDNL